VLLAGCATTLRELRTQEPRLVRHVAGEPAAIAECVQAYAEDHYGGLWGRLGGIGYDTRTTQATTHLIGRVMMAPTDTLFDLALVPATAGGTDLRLWVSAPYHPWLEDAVIEAVNACAPPA